MNYVLIILLNSQQEILLLRRINTTFANHMYSLIGGKIEVGETARQAAIREVHEEVGITLQEKNLQFVHLIHRKGTDSEFFAVTFTVTVWQGNPINNEPNKHDDMRWFALDTVPENSIPAHKQIIECYRKKIEYSEHGW